MNMLERQCQAVCFAWDDDQMNMIGHQTVSEQREPMPFYVLRHQLEINSSIFIRVEDVPLCIATLRDMMRHTGRHYPRKSSHRYKLPNQTGTSRLSPVFPSVPGFPRFSVPVFRPRFSGFPGFPVFCPRFSPVFPVFPGFLTRSPARGEVGIGIVSPEFLGIVSPEFSTSISTYRFFAEKENMQNIKVAITADTMKIGFGAKIYRPQAAQAQANVIIRPQ